MNSARMIFTGFFVLLVSGCAFGVTRYAPSGENIPILQGLKAKGAVPVKVENFTSFEPGLTTIMCRGAGPVEAPDGTTYEDFLRGALISELELAELHDAQSKNIITGHLERIDFGSAIGSGNWTIKMKLIAPERGDFSVQNRYSFSTNFLGDIACRQVAQALTPATRSFWKKVFAHPKFELFMIRPRILPNLTK